VLLDNSTIDILSRQVSISCLKCNKRAVSAAMNHMAQRNLKRLITRAVA